VTYYAIVELRGKRAEVQEEPKEMLMLLLVVNISTMIT
jgi:hypothetical protein